MGLNRSKQPLIMDELLADIHDCMPVILDHGDFDCWLGEELDPRDLMPAD